MRAEYTTNKIVEYDAAAQNYENCPKHECKHEKSNEKRTDRMTARERKGHQSLKNSSLNCETETRDFLHLCFFLSFEIVKRKLHDPKAALKTHTMKGNFGLAFGAELS